MTQDQEQEKYQIDMDFTLWRELNDTTFLMTRLRDKELKQLGITPEMAYIIHCLHKNGGSATMNDLVKITARQHHSISTQIERMSKHGLVEKIRNSVKLRGYNILLTEKGNELFKRITQDSIKTVFSCLSEEDKRILEIRLRALLIYAGELNGTEYKSPLAYIKK